MDGRLRSFLFMSVVAVVTLAAGTAADAFVLPADGTGWVALALLTLSTAPRSPRPSCCCRSWAR